MNTKFLTQNPQGPDQMNIKWSDTKRGEPLEPGGRALFHL
jgi:hypothetical protein